MSTTPKTSIVSTTPTMFDKLRLMREHLDRFRPNVTPVQLRILGLLYLRPDCTLEEIQFSIACGQVVEFHPDTTVQTSLQGLLNMDKIVEKDNRFSLA